MSDNTSYTTEEIARLLKISKLKVYDLIKKGELPSYRVGKQMRVDQSDLEAYKQNTRSGVSTANPTTIIPDSTSNPLGLFRYKSSSNASTISSP